MPTQLANRGEFRELLHGALTATLARLRDACGGAVPIRMVPTLRFEGEGRYSHPQLPRVDLAPLALTIAQSAESDEYQALRRFIAAHDDYARLLLADAAGRRLPEDAELTSLAQIRFGPFAQRYFSLSPRFAFDQETFDQVFSEFVTVLEDQVIEVQFHTSLLHFGSDCDFVEISPTVSLRRLRDDEKVALYEQNIAYPAVAGTDTVHLLSCDFAITQIKRRKLHEPIISVADDAVDDVITALRLLRSGPVGRFMTWATEAQPSFGFDPIGGMSWPLLRAWPTADNYLLTEKDAAQLPRLVEDVVETRRHPADANAGRRAELALRRLSTAYERPTDEDRLIDYWIALEALFIPEEAPAEMTYRASLRIARFLRNEREDREQLFRLMKRSYRTRSKVVHGRRATEDSPAVTRETEAVLREALRKLVTQRGAFDPTEVDLS